jgi:DNA repair protein RecN (Recombination protein N)
LLSRLVVKNFAIIDKIEVEFNEGFNVLTGETGAGKSIVINALNLLLGDRASSDLVRTGEDEASVEGLFELNRAKDINTILDDQDIPLEDGQLIVRRVVNRSGRNRAYLNGVLSPISLLKEIGEKLVDMFSQHDHQSLSKPGLHLMLLDEFSGCDKSRLQITDLVRQRKRIIADIERLTGDSAAERIDYLDFQVKEIDAATLEEGEEEKLTAERRVLVNIEKLAQLSGESESRLYSDDDAIIESLSGIADRVREINELDPAFAGNADAADESIALLEDLATSLRDYVNRLEADPAQLNEVEDRLETIFRLKKKHGGEISDIIARRNQLAEELDELQNAEDRAAKLAIEKDSLGLEILKLARELTTQRTDCAVKLEKKISRELSALNMPRTKFKVFLKPRDGEGADAIGEKGAEDCEFLISPNPGEEPKPLARIASGGELSRVMLSLKSALEKKGLATLVFDEVDSGVGGPTAAAVGERLESLARQHQVIVITHLPQIASMGSTHYHVEKQSGKNSTSTTITQLGHERRIEEVARMLGDREITETTRLQAKEMIERARQ